MSVEPEVTAKLLANTALVLERCAKVFGDGRFATAAAHLRGNKAGRRKINDTAALAYAESLLATGVAKSVHDACLRSAVMYAPEHQVDTVRDRLRKKFGRN